jgi:hypothetical protein
MLAIGRHLASILGCIVPRAFAFIPYQATLVAPKPHSSIQCLHNARPVYDTEHFLPSALKINGGNIRYGSVHFFN